MILAKICILLISVLFICGLTEQSPLNNIRFLPFFLETQPDSGRSPQRLVNLGSVDGVTYFVEKGRKRTWADAKKLCEGFDIKLKLATVLSRAQHDFLLNHLHESHWIGAQEYMTEKAFRWEGINKEPITYKRFYHSSNRHWCLILKNEGGLQGYGSDACTTLHPTLCQFNP